MKDGCQRNRLVEGYEPTTVLDGKREQINIGDLPRADDVAMIENLCIHERDIVGPKLMPRFPQLGVEDRHRRTDQQWLLIPAA